MPAARIKICKAASIIRPYGRWLGPRARILGSRLRFWLTGNSRRQGGKRCRRRGGRRALPTEQHAHGTSAFREPGQGRARLPGRSACGGGPQASALPRHGPRSHRPGTGKYGADRSQHGAFSVTIADKSDTGPVRSAGFSRKPRDLCRRGRPLGIADGNRIPCFGDFGKIRIIAVVGDGIVNIGLGHSATAEQHPGRNGQDCSTDGLETGSPCSIDGLVRPDHGPAIASFSRSGKSHARWELPTILSKSTDK